MGSVREVLAVKGSTVHSVEASATVFEAITRMVAANVGALLVVEEGRLCGIVTERDYLRRVAVQGRTSRDTLVREIMTAEVVCVPRDAEVSECLALMSERRIRHLPVLDGGALAGVVSIGDLVRQVASDRAAEVRMLSDYISGRYPA